MKKLSARDRRTLVAGVLVTILIIFIFYVVLPYQEAQAQAAAELDGKSQLLARSLASIESEETYRSQLADLDRSIARLERQLLEATDSNLARVELESLVRDLAEQSSVIISRSTFLAERSQETRYSKITIQISLQGGLPELANFLYLVSTHPKFLLVEEFNVNAFRARDTVRLQQRMNISGYVRLSSE